MTILRYPSRQSGGRFMSLTDEMAPYLRQRRRVGLATVWYVARLLLFGLACAAIVVSVVVAVVGAI